MGNENLPSNKNNYELPKKVALIYTDCKREYYRTEQEFISEKDADVYAESIAKHVRLMDIKAESFACDENIAVNLKNFKPDIAINLVDSVRGKSWLGSSVIGLLEILNIPYTGSGTLGWSLGTNKYLMYQLMQSSGIPVPDHQLFNSASEMINPVLRYPLFAKLNVEHSSIGIDANNICENEAQLRAKLRDMFSTFQQPVIVDEYIAGIEITASVLDGINTKVYAVQRKTGKDSIGDVVTFDKKWKDYMDMSYEKYDSPYLKDHVKKAFEVLKISDYARIDIRVDSSGRLFFIDPNCNPYIGPPEDHATYNIILDMYGIEFKEFLKRLFINTAIDTQVKELELSGK